MSRELAIFESALDRMSANRLREDLDSADREHAERERATDAEQFAADEIRQAFALRGTAPMERIAVPCTEFKQGRTRVCSETLAKVMLETLDYPEIEAALLQALEKSDCLLLAKVRELMCERWIKNNASDIAEARL